MDATTDRRLGRAALIVTTFIILVVGVTAAVAFRTRGAVAIPPEWRSQSDYTLIIFGRESCSACQASAAFHKELAAAAEAHGIRTIAALTDRSENPSQFAASIGIAPDHALRANPAPEHLKTVPTVIIVNRTGEVLKQTQGALSVDKQRTLLNFVTNLR